MNSMQLPHGFTGAFHAARLSPTHCDWLVKAYCASLSANLREMGHDPATNAAVNRVPGGTPTHALALRRFANALLAGRQPPGLPQPAGPLPAFAALEELDETKHLASIGYRSHPSQADCRAAFDEALALVEAAGTHFADEARTFLRVCLASENLREMSGSASFENLPFHVVLVFAGDEGQVFRIAEDIVHEVSHQKVYLANQALALLHSDGRRRFRHPWRLDPRPIIGVLLGAHAHLAIMGFMAALADHPRHGAAAARRLAELDGQVAEAMATVGESGLLTDAGRIFFEEMAEAYFSIPRGPQ